MYTIAFPDVATAILQIFLMGLAGFILIKKQLVDEPGLNVLARLLVCFFWPCYVFYHLSQEFRFSDYAHWWIFPLLSFGVTLCGLLVGRGMLAFFPRIQQRKEFATLVAFQNSGFAPLMLVTTMLAPLDAQRMTNYILIFLIGFDLMIWTIGVWLLRGRKPGTLDFNSFLNPPLVAIVTTLTIVALGWQQFLPTVILKPVKFFSDCALPVALLVAGGNLATLKTGGNVSRRAVLGSVFSKLVLMPLVAIGIVQLFHFEFWMGFLVVLQAVVPSAVTLSILARYYDGIDEHFVNQGLFLSHILCLLTIPVFLSLYLHLRAF